MFCCTIFAVSLAFMLLLPTLLLVSGQFNNLPAPGSNGSLATSFYIVSTSESRVPGAAIYMYDDFENTCSGNGRRRLQEAGRRLQGDTCGNVLQSAMGSVGDFATACVCTSCTSCTSSMTFDRVEYNDPLQYARTLIIPVPDSPDHYYLVGSDYSPLRGWSAYAAGVPGDVVSTMIDAEIYNDVSPAARGQWRIIPSELSSDGLAYHIVSAASAEAPDEMIKFIDGRVQMTGRAYDSTDTRALWRILPAPPSPPIDYSTIEDTRGRAMARILSWLPMAIFIPLFFLVFCLLMARGYYKRRRERQARDSHGIPMQPAVPAVPVVAQAVPGAVPVAQAVPMP